MNDPNQTGFQLGNTSPIGSLGSTSLDDALRDAAMLICQQNTGTSPSPTGSSNSGQSEQAVGLLMLLQELIRTQQGRKEDPGGRNSPLGSPYLQQMLATQRFSLDGTSPSMRGHLGLGLGGTCQWPLVQASTSPEGIYGSSVPVQSSAENMGMLWDGGVGDVRKRLSMDDQWQGPQG